MYTLLKTVCAAILLASLCQACHNRTDSTSPADVSPLHKSTGDSLAIRTAHHVAEAAGGMESFDATRYLCFDFFGSRTWWWDKHAERYRVESAKAQYRIAGTLDGEPTYLWLKGSVIADNDSIAKYRDLAYKAWINDTYWLVLPFKLLDPGVHLRYAGAADSTRAEVRIELTFDDVGVTPDNKYVVYVDTTTYRIVQWEYFRKAQDSLPQISNPWTDYKSYGDIVLSSGRGPRNLSGIAVHHSLPDELFSDVSRAGEEIFQEQLQSD